MLTFQHTSIINPYKLISEETVLQIVQKVGQFSKFSQGPVCLERGGLGLEARRRGRRRIEAMPAGKYYCDYCDKEFKDTLPARKRHLSGIHHQRNRSFYYDSLNKGTLFFLSQTLIFSISFSFVYICFPLPILKIGNVLIPDPTQFSSSAHGFVKGICNRFVKTVKAPSSSFSSIYLSSVRLCWGLSFPDSGLNNYLL